MIFWLKNNASPVTKPAEISGIYERIYLFIYLLSEQEYYHGIKIQQTETQVESCTLGTVFNLLSDSHRWTRH